MKKTTIILLFFLCSTIFFSNCRKEGFTRQEVELIRSGKAYESMRLFTIDEKSDSLLLRNPNRKIRKSQIGSETLELLEARMLSTVTDSLNPGVGIAAPQVGINVRMVCVQRFDLEKDPFIVYYNPEITYFGDSINSGLEGCLSVPGYRGRIDRSHNITLSYLGQDGKYQKENIEGFTAVIFQHEVDHLNGVLYFDRIYGGFRSLTEIEEP